MRELTINPKGQVHELTINPIKTEGSGAGANHQPEGSGARANHQPSKKWPCAIVLALVRVLVPSYWPWVVARAIVLALGRCQSHRTGLNEPIWQTPSANQR